MSRPLTGIPNSVKYTVPKQSSGSTRLLFVDCVLAIFGPVIFRSSVWKSDKGVILECKCQSCN